MRGAELPRAVLDRRAIVYVRQSTMEQAENNLESQRRQYDLVKLAREYGFTDVSVIDEDVGLSAGGAVARPGFESLVAQVCHGTVGAVVCLEASRLARNGRDWHHLLELCGLVGAHVIDVEGLYNPAHPNDRLLLGLKGTMSEFELTLLRRRLTEGAANKAARGELRLLVPVGYLWERDAAVTLDPDQRIQGVIRTVFRLFDRLGSARQVHRYMCSNELSFPRPVDGKQLKNVRWSRPGYRNIISVLKNPFYAGAYAYGKSGSRTLVIDGRARKTHGCKRPIEEWTVLLKHHHQGYIDWETYERNQRRLARNAFGKIAGGSKSGRGGRALLAGLLRCRRCGRMLNVAYPGNRPGLIRYTCRTGAIFHGLARCVSFAGTRADRLVSRLLLEAVQPMAVEASLVAHKQVLEMAEERRQALQLEIKQARYEVHLAQRRYEAVDPDNRLVAGELEVRWNHALQRLRDCEERYDRAVAGEATPVDESELMRLAGALEQTWESPSTDMRSKQRLVRALIEEIGVHVDAATREVVLMVHWKGGEHSEHRFHKPRTGHHTKQAPQEAGNLIKQMAGRWSDKHIAASLNRMRLKTGQGNPWTDERVRSFRRYKGIHAIEHPDRRCLTMQQAAECLGVSQYFVRKLIQHNVLPAQQVLPKAPWQILEEDLSLPNVRHAVDAQRNGQTPRNVFHVDHTLTIPGI